MHRSYRRETLMKNRTIVGLLVCGTLLTGSASAAQRWGMGPRPDAGACFYEYPNFQGRPPDRDQRFDEGGSRGDNDGPPRDRLRQDESAPQQGSRGDAGAAMTREQAQALVRAAYLSVLKREPDPGGSADWVSRVLN